MELYYFTAFAKEARRIRRYKQSGGCYIHEYAGHHWYNSGHVAVSNTSTPPPVSSWSLRERGELKLLKKRLSNDTQTRYLKSITMGNAKNSSSTGAGSGGTEAQARFFSSRSCLSRALRIKLQLAWNLLIPVSTTCRTLG